jgi:deoxyribodipyrimidine photo-lyase
MRKSAVSRPPAIWWIRRDLRLTDNRALVAALARGGGVLPVFVLDPAVLESPAHRDGLERRAFLVAGLRALDGDLRSRGSRLVVRRGDPARVLEGLVAETGAAAVCAEADFTPYARRRDAAVSARLPLELAPGLTVHDPGEVVKPDGRPYTVFTPFSRAWRARPLPVRGQLIPAPRRIATPAGPASESLPEAGAVPSFPPGEAEARRRLEAFAAGAIASYAEGRNRLDLDGTSALSPYLRFGMLSAREAVVRASEAAAAGRSASRASVEAWIGELIWREFYIAVLRHFPEVRRTAFDPAFRRIRWRKDPAGLAAWQEGRTGYPVVDAGMRQLLATGWMHNRARMIAASFLVKDLLIDWRQGERWFMRLLVDGDPAANGGGWQWTAGVGTDAAPYFRIFNPVLQGRRFDPEGAYVRRWVPELARVPDRHLHEPWTMPAAAQAEAGCRLGRDYPMPIVEHARARERALEAYRRSREGALPPRTRGLLQ